MDQLFTADPEIHPRRTEMIQVQVVESSWRACRDGEWDEHATRIARQNVETRVKNSFFFFF